MRKLTKYTRPVLTDAKRITQFPTEFLAKDTLGRPLTDTLGILTGEMREATIQLRFHLAKLTLEHPTGTTTTLTHTVKHGKHKVTWKNDIPGIRPMTRTFYHPDNLADFLVPRYGMVLTTKILKALSALEQGEQETL